MEGNKKNTKRNPKPTKGGSSRPRVQSQSPYRPQMYEPYALSPRPVYHTQMYESPSVYRPQMSELQPQSSSEGTSKKRKSSDSSNVPTPPSVHEFDCELPNLNVNPTPSCHSRCKKKKNVKTSSSMRDILETYLSVKLSLLEARLEGQKKKDEAFFKFIEGEVYNRDMKFVMDSHNNIPDPAFKEFVIGRKRELCAKYGWPCSL